VKFLSEFLGTALLVFLGVGSAISARQTGGVIVVGLTFGLVMLALSYALAPVSGAHLNPAVTLGALFARVITPASAVAYWAAQVLGAIAAAFLLYALVRWAGVIDETDTLGANEYGGNINAGGTVVLEFILTFLFVLVVLLVTSRTAQRAVRGMVIGLTLGVCNLVAIPLDGASINPARSIGPALFNGGAPLRQLWLFILVPLAAGAAAAFAAGFFKRAPDQTDSAEEPPPRSTGGGTDWKAVDVRTRAGQGRPAVGSEAASKPKRASRR
jgi:aquaporin Z